MDRIPVLLDTDIGSDIDDAVCLAYLLDQPRCEMLGITTVSGQPRLRAALADAVCRAAGRGEVPIHAGVEHGLLSGAVVQPNVPQAPVLERWSARRPEDFPAHTAIEFLRRTIEARPGEIVLLGIGPMTNLALLFATYPHLPGLLRGVMLMCGIFRTWWHSGHLEWNALCDPAATAIAYRPAIASHRSVPIDVTMRCQLPGPEAIARFQACGGAMGLVADMTGFWGGGRKTVTFHDPLAAVAIFKPELCQWTRGRVAVELDSKRLAGHTHLDPAADGPHEVALEVDPAAFFEEYFAVVGAQPPR